MGDLLVRVNMAQHPSFIIQKNNVLSNFQVPLKQLIKGSKLEVPTMYGIQEVKLKPGTKPGTTVKIPNCGVNKRNFHIIMIQLLFPEETELKNGSEWQGFGIEWDSQ